MARVALAGVDGTVIPVGLSMGGIVALEIWRQAPERVTALALFDTNPGADTADRRAKRDAQVLAATHGDFELVVNSQLAPAYFSTQTERAADQFLRDTVLRMALDQGVGAFAAQATALATRLDSWNLLREIRVPTLVACGADDRICPQETQERMASLLPNGTFHSIPDAGHLAPLEQPEATIRILLNWFEQSLSLKYSYAN